MISFTSFASTLQDSGYASMRHPVSKNDIMDFDEFDDLESDGTNKLTCPGEALTSSQAYMR